MTKKYKQMVHVHPVHACSVMSGSLWSMGLCPPGSSVWGISQARMLEWVAISYFRESSQPRDQTHIFLLHLLHCQADSVPCTTWKRIREFSGSPVISIFTDKGTVSIPGLGTRIPKAAQMQGQTKKRRKSNGPWAYKKMLIILKDAKHTIMNCHFLYIW